MIHIKEHITQGVWEIRSRTQLTIKDTQSEINLMKSVSGAGGAILVHAEFFFDSKRILLMSTETGGHSEISVWSLVTGSQQVILLSKGASHHIAARNTFQSGSLSPDGRYDAGLMKYNDATKLAHELPLRIWDLVSGEPVNVDITLDPRGSQASNFEQLLLNLSAGVYNIITPYRSYYLVLGAEGFLPPVLSYYSLEFSKLCYFFCSVQSR